MQLNRYIYIGFLMLLLLHSCKSVFKVSPYKTYLNKLESTGLSKTKMGKAWVSNGEEAVRNPLKEVTIPFQESIFFRESSPDALGYIIHYSSARKVKFKVKTTAEEPFGVFIDILERKDQLNNLVSIQSADTVLFYEDKQDKTLILRLQPELLVSGRVDLEIIDEPKLGFPVKGASNSSIKSFWGVDRDGGVRRHEGIDIFAKRGTPVIAVEDGVISRVQETNLGGKVVWQRLGLFGQMIYYAHLDSQLVTAGQEVKKGETVGLLGNTGNAKATAPHLHFGIYTGSGAVDPLNYVLIKDTVPPKLRSEIKYLGNEVVINRGASSAVPVNILSVSSEGVSYKNEFQKLEYSEKLILLSKKPSAKIKTAKQLYKSPVETSAPVGLFNPEKSYTVLAKTGTFVYINQEDTKGWVLSD